MFNPTKAITAQMVETETRHYVRCTVCNDCKANAFNVTKAEAVKIFRAEGWRGTEENILCPDCYANGEG